MVQVEEKGGAAVHPAALAANGPAVCQAQGLYGAFWEGVCGCAAVSYTHLAENVHTASITYAVRDTLFDGRDIHAGDIMGLIDNKLHYLGHDVREVAEHLTEEMVTEDKSLITIYYGEDVSEEDAQALLAALSEKYDQCDVDLQHGGQPLYYYLIAVE